MSLFYVFIDIRYVNTTFDIRRKVCTITKIHYSHTARYYADIATEGGKT